MIGRRQLVGWSTHDLFEVEISLSKTFVFIIVWSEWGKTYILVSLVLESVVASQIRNLVSLL